MFLLWSFPYLRPVKDRGCHLCSLVAIIIDCQLKVVSHDDCWTLDSVLCSPCPAWSCLPSPALPALPGSCSHGLARKRSTLAPWSQNKRTVLGSLAKWMLQTIQLKFQVNFDLAQSFASLSLLSSKTYRTVSGINPVKVGAGECEASLAFFLVTWKVVIWSAGTSIWIPEKYCISLKKIIS